MCLFNGIAHFKNVNSCLNTNIYSYLETSGGQSSNLYLNVVHFLTPGLIRHLWQLKTVVYLHWCLNTCYSIAAESVYSIDSDECLTSSFVVKLQLKKGINGCDHQVEFEDKQSSQRDML
jgi:hypothetical protein